MESRALLAVIFVAASMALSQNWVQEATLTAARKFRNGSFGSAVSITDSYALVGASGTPYEGLESAGAAYVFRRQGDAWSEEAVLRPSESFAQVSFGFGFSVAISTDFALIGAPLSSGRAYIFSRSGTTWTQQVIFAPNNSPHLYAFSVALEGSLAVVGSPYQTDPDLPPSGVVYVYSNNGNSWVESAILSPSNPISGGYFGYGVSIKNDMILAGAPYVDGSDYYGNVHHSGAAYVFSKSGSNWLEQAILTINNKASTDYIGGVVALGDNYLIIASHHSSRRACFFSRSGNTWTETQSFEIYMGERRSVSIHESRAIISNKVFTLSGGVWAEQSSLSSGQLSSAVLYGRYVMLGHEYSDPNGVQDAGEVRPFKLEGEETPSPLPTVSASRSRSEEREDAGPSLTRAPNPQTPRVSQGPLSIFHRTISSSSNNGKGFGSQVALEGDILLISKPICPIQSTSLQCGRVYLLQRHQNSWQLIARLRYGGSVSKKTFGRSLAIHNGKAFISGDYYKDNSRHSEVHVFEINTESSSVQRGPRIRPPITLGNSYGIQISARGSFVSLGVPLSRHSNGQQKTGAVLVYQVSTERNWEKQEFTIQPSILTSEERFGSTLTMSNEGIIAVGNQCDDENIQGVYVFHLPLSGVLVYQKISFSGKRGFGKSLFLQENVLYVGAPEDSSQASDAGSLHVYKMTAEQNFVHHGQIGAQSLPGSRFGSSICVSANYLLSASNVCQTGQGCLTAGKVSVFRKSGSSWVFISDLSSGYHDNNDRFGVSVSCSDEIFAVGAPGSTNSEEHQPEQQDGSVHVYMF